MKRSSCNLAIFLFPILITFCTVSSQADTSVPAGTIVDTTWTKSGSPYLIEGNILVAGLTIEPGVRVEFMGNYIFEVAGTLTAVGTETVPIVFTRSESNTEGWQGIFFNYSNSDCLISYCTIEGSINSGIRIDNSQPTIQNSIITDNSGVKGGGISIVNNSVFTLENCEVSDNSVSGGNGGGIYIDGGEATINNCTIKNNSVYNNYGYGGGIYAGGNIEISNSFISNNSISYSTCSANVRGYGGGIYTNGETILKNCEFQNNSVSSVASWCGVKFSAYSYGGAGYFNGALTASNCIIGHNELYAYASCSSCPEGISGAGFYCNSSDINSSITNCTFAYNTVGGISSGNEPVTIKNSIFWDNGSDQISGNVIVSYSNVQDGFEGEGNIASNPVFKSETDLMIVPGSPCIDAGNPDSQYNDECFPFSLGTQRNDMGAHGGPGGCNWAPPDNVAYYYIVADTIQDLWKYNLELHAITWEREDLIIGSSWSISDESMATLEGNTVTGLKNGHVLVSTSYLGRTYTKTIYFKASGSFESETNNNISSADTLAEQTYMEGELLEGDIDYYKLVVNQFQSAEFAFFSRSLTADVLVEILDSSENVIASATSTDGESVRIHAGLRPGNYYIKISSAGDIDDDKTYDIIYSEVDPALNLVFEAESNNTLADANDLVIDETIEGRLSANDDQDFFRVLLNAPVYADLVFQCQGNDSTKQFIIDVYNSSEDNLINSFTVSEGSPVSLPMGLNIAEYFIKVSGVEGHVETALPYTFSLKTSSHPDIEIESNNTIPFANPLAKEQAKTGLIYSAGDIDIYGFEATQIGVIHIDFNPTTTTGDYKISILDKNGNEKYAKTSLDGDPRTLNYGIETSDYYYVKVEALDGGDIDSNHYYELLMTSDIEIQPIVGLVSISIEAPSDHIAINDQMQLTLKKHFSDTSFQLLEGGDLISLQPAVASIDSNGVVTGLANGNVTIVGIYEGFTAKFSLTVGTGENATQHHGNLIIMTGSGDTESDPLTGAAQYLSDLLYKRFKNRLFQNEDIYYFNPVSYHDLDGDGYDNNVVDDSSPTVSEFGQAITNWAAAQSTDGPLFIYMVGHGEADTFWLSCGNPYSKPVKRLY